MRYGFLGLCFLGAILFASAGSQASIIQFDLRGNAGTGLLGGNENPAVVTTGTGGETGLGISFDDAVGSKVLTLNVGWGTINNFTNISGLATGFHIHQAGSSAFTANGGVIIDFLPGGATLTNTLNGGGLTNHTVTLSASQEAALLAGQLYLNVHTALNGGGEIRGNLVAVPEPTSLCLLGLTITGFTFRRAIRKKFASKVQSNA